MGLRVKGLAVMQRITADNSGIDDFCKNAKNGQLSDFTIFANFEPELYMLWSFGKATV